MADVDTSIYNKFLPPPTAMDPLKTFGQVVGIQNAQQQNKLLQQTQDLRSATGEAAIASTERATGAFDFNKYQGLTGSDPRSAWNQPDIIAQAATNQKAQADAQVAMLASKQAHVEAANGYISATLGNPALGKTDQYDTIVKTINDMWSHNANLGTPAERDALIAQVPKGDPLGQKQFVLNAANQNFAIQRKLEPLLAQGYGTPVQVDTGQKVLGGTQASPTQGGALNVPAQTGVQRVTGPDFNAGFQRITVPEIDSASGQTKLGPDGKPTGVYQDVYVPRGQLPGASGVAGPFVAGPSVVPPAGSPPQLAAPATAGSGITGTRPASGQAPVAAPPSGAVLAAPPPGVSESQNADVTRYKGDQAAIPVRQTNVQSLQKAQVALDALAGPLGTGKGTETLAGLKSVLSSLGIGFNDSTLNRDEAKKYLLDYAKGQGAAAHSDQQLNAALGSNASTEISNAAALDVVKTNIGRERQAIAQVQEHANPTGIGYGQHAANFANSTDPRAFAWNQYSHPEQQKILSGLDKAGRTKFAASLQIAAKYGFAQPEGASGGQ